MKYKIDISFVILHYKTDKQTINCINSIINNIDKKYVIVVVDNYSNNGSIEKVEKKFYGNDNIKIIKSTKNIGFANGNNLGIKWINNNFDVKYIVVLNNDTKILDHNFYDLIDREYKKTKFAVMGPKIVLKDNSINPICKQDVSLRKAKYEKRFIIRQLIIKIFHLENLTIMIKKIIKKNKNNINNSIDTNTYHKNIVLHGCFLIFSQDYFAKYDGFDDRTFLYHEEELLFLRIKKAKLLSVYNPSIKIYHEEDAATNFAMPKERKRAIFKLKNVYKSNKILIKELKEMER